MQTQKGRIIELDIVRVIGVFLVVLGHLVNEHPIRMYIYAFHMPLFFLVSGMLYKAKNCLSDLRIFRKYIIPALFFMILFHLCWYPVRLLYSIHNLSAISFDDITIETLNHIFTDFTKILQFNPIVANIPIWFLFALGWCNFFLFLCMKRKWFALLPLVILVLSQWVKLPLFFSQASFAYPFFLVGYLLKNRIVDNFHQKSISKLMICIFLCTITLLLIPNNGSVSMFQCYFGEMKFPFNIMSYYLIGFTLSLVLICFIGSFRWETMSIVNYIAQSFISILGIQYFFTTLYGIIIGFDNYLIIEIVAAVFIVLACCIIHKFLEFICPKLIGK